MTHILKTLLPVMVVLQLVVTITPQAEAAATSKGDFLKFYPISAQQYSSIIELMQQQEPAVHEGRVLNDGHRSIAEWSNSLPSGWNDIFNISHYTDDASLDKDVKGYPLCVLKANSTAVRRKRGGRQYDYDYAGVSPTVVYTGGPSYPEYAAYGSPVYGPAPDTEKPASGNAIVNCVVVLRRDKEPKPTTTTTTKKPGVFPPPGGYPLPPGGYPFPPGGYPLPPGGYPNPPGGYPFPPPFYGYPGVPPYGGYPAPPPQTAPPATLRNYDGNSPPMDANAQLLFQAMLNEYYQQLAKLYMANGGSPVGRELTVGKDKLSHQTQGSVEASKNANYDYDDDDGDNDDDDDEYDDDDNDKDADGIQRDEEEYDDIN